MSIETGSRIFDYEVTGVLGAGGMGKVYKVRNVISDRVDAMKVLLPSLSDQPELADRFLREIKVLASLDHPNIAAFHTALRFENQLIMIMELVNGTTLSDRLARGRIPLEEGLAYTKQMLSALAYAHGQGIIHRDIKPANMMITPEGRIKLMDFGIAKAAADPHLTRTGTTVGSLYYISPEQLSGGKLDGRSDLYSLGVTMYEIVTGKRPFEGKSEYSLMAAHLQESPRPPEEIDSNLPPMVNAAILKSLEKNPDNRFQTADEFRAALAPGLASKPAPSVSPAVVRTAVASQPRSPGHRGRYMLLGAAVAVILIVAGVTQLPKWLKARATPESSASAAAQSQPGPHTALQSQPAPEMPANPAAPSQSTILPVAAGGGSAAHSLSSDLATKKAEANRIVKGSEGVDRSASQTWAAKRLEQRSAQASPAATASAARNQETPPPAAADHTSQDAAAFQALEDRMSQLSGRANAVKTTVANMQQQEAATGNSLRPDVLASESRMERYMDQADSALTARDQALAKHNMDLAEREISSLEKFLGR